MRKILEFPENRQVYNYDCGSNSVLSVLQYYGYMGREDKIMELADTDKDGTSGEGICDALNYFKVRYEEKQGMTVEEIRELIDRGFPVIISIQAYPDELGKDLSKSVEDGHFVVAIGYDEGGIILEDPSCCYRTYLTDKELMERWHDEDEYHWSLVVFGTPVYKKDIVIPLKENEMKDELIAKELVRVAKDLMADVMSPFELALRKAIADKIREEKRSGTVSMSLENLMQIVRPPSSSLEGAPRGTNARYYYSEMFKDFAKDFRSFIGDK